MQYIDDSHKSELLKNVHGNSILPIQLGWGFQTGIGWVWTLASMQMALGALSQPPPPHLRITVLTSNTLGDFF